MPSLTASPASSAKFFSILVTGDANRSLVIQKDTYLLF